VALVESILNNLNEVSKALVEGPKKQATGGGVEKNYKPTGYDACSVLLFFIRAVLFGSRAHQSRKDRDLGFRLPLKKQR
jgi:hypothetical protein